MKKVYDLLVIGGGVLGTFHAYHALQKNMRVCLMEQNNAPQSATTRNFGQVVPSGMNVKWQQYGRRSLEIYADIQQKFDITVRNNGSVYLASDSEEERLLSELSEINRLNAYRSVMFDKAECLKRYAKLNPEYVKSGLFFPEEVTVEPRTMIHQLHQFLKEQKGLDVFSGFPAIDCTVSHSNVVVTRSDGNVFKAAKVIICNGSDFHLLFPELFKKSRLILSKLQMMQTGPQPGDYRLPGSILTGWSIRRYEAFSECPSFAEIKEKEDKNSPQRKWGVHILFKQAADGSVIIGDSHQYAPAANPEILGYDLDMSIDRFMQAEATKIIDLPNQEIQHRWFGVYSQTPEGDVYQENIEDKIHIVTGIGGKGMTASAGFSEESINLVFNL